MQNIKTSDRFACKTCEVTTTFFTMLFACALPFGVFTTSISTVKCTTCLTWCKHVFFHERIATKTTFSVFHFDYNECENMDMFNVGSNPELVYY